MKKALVTILILGVLGAGGYGAYQYFFAGEGEVGGRVSSTSEDAVYVDLISEITGFGSGTGLYDRYGGEVEPQATLDVKLESDRTVDECFVKVGDEVKEGQKLFTYDTREDEDKLAQAEIEIERCNSDIEICEEEIKQYEKELKSADEDEKSTYTTQILTAQNTIKRTEYEIKTLELEMEQLKETIENATVYAEMDGIIQKINDTSESNYSYSYSDNDTAYITILALGDYRIKGSINEQNLNQIYTGMPVIVYSRVDESLTWNGTISEINTDKAEESDEDSYYYYGNDSASSSYAFYVELDTSEGLILGQHVYMEENVGQGDQKDGLWLEEYYIMQEDDQAYVWLANTSNVIEKHAITLGEYDESLMKYEVTDGLAADDYIAYPTDTIEEGAPVIYNDYSSSSGTADIINDLPYVDYDDYNADSYNYDSTVDSSVSGGSLLGSLVDDIDYFDADAEEEVYDSADDMAVYDSDDDMTVYDAEDDMEVYDAADDMAVYDDAEGMSLGEDAGMASFG